MVVVVVAAVACRANKRDGHVFLTRENHQLFVDKTMMSNPRVSN